MSSLFVFGLGYTALHFIWHHQARFTEISGTVTTEAKAKALWHEGIDAFVLAEHETRDILEIRNRLSRATHLLITVPPQESGDICLPGFREKLMGTSQLSWIGYLSTTGVYGDRQGGWVDETTKPLPSTPRSRARLMAEEQWLDIGRIRQTPTQIFRLSGIYGPGRNALLQIAEGTAQRIIKPGHVFNRIHVEDIGAALAASMDKPKQGGLYNLSDNEPAPPQDVIAYAAELSGYEPPPPVAYEEAELSPMAKSFYEECKRVRNQRLKQELGVTLRYPTYREGLQALYESGEGQDLTLEI